MSAAAGEVEVELEQWRDRLAAASRNVSELSELPAYGAVRALAGGTGRIGDAARGLVATMDELWQGVLLIGAALDRADQAHKAGLRLWRADDGGRKVLEILRGPSITVDLSDTPVLHRRLLAGPRHTATVSPETLLATMDAAFDRARQQLTQIAEASSQATALRARVAASVGLLPAAGDATARLAAADALSDPLDRADALRAMLPDVEAAVASAVRAGAALAAAQAACAALRTVADTAEATALRELAAWLDRIGRTLASGRTEAAVVGLGNWQALHDRLAGEIRARTEAAAAAIARADDLRGRLGALRAKHRARGAGDAALDTAAETAKVALAATPLDVDAASRALAAYEAALARR